MYGSRFIFVAMKLISLYKTTFPMRISMLLLCLSCLPAQVLDAQPTANFTANVTSGCAPLQVQFTDLSTTTNDQIVDWQWDFDDGNISVMINPTTTFLAGSYTVCLRVIDNAGAVDTLCRFGYINVDPDTEPPVINCPAEEIVTADPGRCAATAFNLAPATSDNCSSVSLIYSIAGATSGTGTGDVSGSAFNIGISQVTYTGIDGVGNTANCAFNVTADMNPMLSCRSDTVTLGVCPTCPNTVTADMILESNYESCFSQLPVTIQDLAGTTTYPQPLDDSHIGLDLVAIVKDPATGNSCQSDLVVKDGLEISVLVTDVSCSGGTDGSISISVMGGIPPYTYQWDPNITNSGTAFNLSAGDYNITISDASGLSETMTIVVDEPDPIEVDLIVQDVSCYGEFDGQCILGPITGGCSPYAYIWSTGATTPSLFNLSAGTYVITITDCNGCNKIENFVVTEPPPISIQLSASCSLNDPASGSIDATVSGGILPYSFIWNNGVTTEDISNLSADEYILTVVDDNGCTAVTTATVGLVDASIAQDSFELCRGETAAIQINTSQTLNYLWQGDSLSCTTCPDPIASPIVPSTYTCLITDPNSGCISQVDVWVDVIGDCVWPGDTDSSRVVNQFDILNLGLGYGASGPVRPFASIQWGGQPAPDWQQNTPNTNIDYKYSDTDGNGLLDMDDTLAIALNWGQSHFLLGESPKEKLLELPPAGRGLMVPFYVATDTFIQGSTVSLPVILGEAGNPAVEVYGLAFSLEYDSSIVEPNQIFLNLQNGWIGQLNQDMIQLQRNYHNPGRLDVGLSRIDGTPVTGFGEIGSLIITIEDDILLLGDDVSGRGNGETELRFNISNVRLINAQEEEIEVNPLETIVLIQDIGTATSTAWLDGQLRIFPNPVSDRLHLSARDLELKQLQLLDISGRQVLATPASGSAAELPIGHLPEGSYLLKVACEQGLVFRKVVVMR